MITTTTAGESRSQLRLADLIGALTKAPSQPRLVSYGSGGERTELSGASLANWTAKTAGMLTDEMGLGIGNVAVIGPSDSWQVAPVLLACWWAGVTVTMDDDAAAKVAAGNIAAGTGAAADVAFIAGGTDHHADEVLVLSSHPFGMPTADIAAHQRHFTPTVLPHPDRVGAPATNDQWDAVIDGCHSYSPTQLVAFAQTGADTLVGTADKPAPVLLTTNPWRGLQGAWRELVITLAANGTLVHCPGLMESGCTAGAGSRSPEELARLAHAEHVTATVAADVPGIRTLSIPSV